MSITLRIRRVTSWLSDHRPGIKVKREFGLLLVQLAGAAAVIYGISLYSHPIAFIIGGVGAILAIETQSRERKETPEEQQVIKERIKAALAAAEDPFEKPGVPLTPTYLTYAASLRRRQ